MASPAGRPRFCEMYWQSDRDAVEDEVVDAGSWAAGVAFDGEAPVGFPDLDPEATAKADIDIFDCRDGVVGYRTRARSQTGVARLMLALLEEAIKDYLSPSKARREAAERWICSRRRWIFSFSAICEALDLEPEAVRSALRQLRSKSIATKIAPNRTAEFAYRTHRHPAKRA